MAGYWRLRSTILFLKPAAAVVVVVVVVAASAAYTNLPSHSPLSSPLSRLF